jgi:hypothetical protein
VKANVIIFFICRYDAHFLVRELAFEVEDGRVEANNEERFVTFSKKFGAVKVQFVDTLRFMPHSLESLVSFLKPDDIVHISLNFPSDKMKLATRKGVFCYDYVNTMDKLKETSLPDKKEFYNKLNETDIGDADYEHAQNVWREFNIQNLGEYSDLYLKIDVLLLADVFERFRKMCLNDYKLDPAWYFTTPGLSWDAALRFTKVKLDLLTDVDMLLMFERGMIHF